MANVELARDDAEGEAVARLLDPIALEARLADARARRAAVLAAKAEAELLPPPVNLPGLVGCGDGGAPLTSVTSLPAHNKSSRAQ